MKNPYIILAAIIAAAILVAVWMLKSLVVQPPTGSFHDAVDEGYLEVVKQHLAAKGISDVSIDTQCRFLAGMSVPLFTRNKVRQLSGFGLCEQQRYSDIKALLQQL